MDQTPLAGLSVLILEDEFIIALDLEQTCRDHGAEVSTHRSLAELGPDPFERRFDVALLDVMLEGQSTLDFARTLIERGTPVVFSTGYSASEDMLKDFPGTPVITKPYGPKDVIDVIRTVAAR